MFEVKFVSFREILYCLHIKEKVERFEIGIDLPFAHGIVAMPFAHVIVLDVWLLK